MPQDTSQGEYSESGEPIFHHEASDSNPNVAPTDEQTVEKIREHVEAHVGNYTFVFREVVSEYVHIDVHIIAPNAKHNFYTLVTTGMSDRPMQVPPGAQQWRYAEMLICLPREWPIMSQEAMQQNENFWPIRAMKMLARLPHQYDTWLSSGHTIPNGDPAEPFAPNTKLCCALISEPLLFGKTFQTLEVSPNKTIHFLALVPIYLEEMDYKLSQGAGALFEQLDAAGVTELLDIHRNSAV